MTKAEACLWKYALSKKRLLGLTFRRQRPILQYIVDFVCLKLKLVIEVDGYSHEISENQEKDVLRQKDLENSGFVVLRFKDEEVLNDMKNVIERIEFSAKNLLEQKTLG
jgi:very-short-patch-repair endonuclease